LYATSLILSMILNGPKYLKQSLLWERGATVHKVEAEGRQSCPH
jgi:hypothetical protein